MALTTFTGSLKGVPDHLGSTSAVTNLAGAVVEKTTYKPYGEVLSGGNDCFLYIGQEKDNTDLMYYGARYYDPSNKLWTILDAGHTRVITTHNTRPNYLQNKYGVEVKE